MHRTPCKLSNNVFNLESASNPQLQPHSDIINLSTIIPINPKMNQNPVHTIIHPRVTKKIWTHELSVNLFWHLLIFPWISSSSFSNIFKLLCSYLGVGIPLHVYKYPMLLIALSIRFFSFPNDVFLNSCFKVGFIISIGIWEYPMLQKMHRI